MVEYRGMRNAKIVLFLICVITVSTQTFRHFYVKYLADDSSILDKYMTEIELEIKKSRNLKELEVLYIDNKNKMEKIENSGNEKYEETKEYKDLRIEKNKIVAEIRGAESLKESKHKLLVYWIIGFVCVLFGCISYFFTSKWISFASLISGFSEMAVWTSPFFDRINTLNFIELLNMKLILSIITLILVLSVWLLNEKYIDKTLGKIC